MGHAKIRALDTGRLLVRKVCKVNTRGMLSTDPAARAAWRSLDKEFQETMQAERAFG